MSLYIRALCAYPIVLIVFGVIIICDFVLYWVSERVQYSNISFVSNMLEPEGWKITLPLNISRCYTHKVKRHPTKVPLIIMSCNVLCNMISFYVTLTQVADEDIICYTFINGLLLLAAILLWYSRCREVLGQTKHEEYLKLVELCHCPNNPSCTVLILVDRLGYAYTYVTTGTFRWKTNFCYLCLCYDDYILDLDSSKAYDPENLYYTPVNTLRSNAHWFIYTTPRLCGLLSLLCSSLYILTDCVVFMAMAITFIFTIVVTFPYNHTMELNCHIIKRSVTYKDLPDDCTYTFVLLDKSGNPYYYQTDDVKALDINRTYEATVRGRNVVTINHEVEINPAIDYEPPKNTGEISGFLLLWLMGALVLDFLNLHLVSVVVSAPLAICCILMLRYRKKGEI